MRGGVRQGPEGRAAREPGAGGSVPVTGTFVAAASPEAPDAPEIGQPVAWQIAEEVPVSLCYDGRPHAVMMATPADLEDFALGFSLSEGLVEDVGGIEQVEVGAALRGLRIDLRLRRGAGRAHPPRPTAGPRAIEGRSGCGLCGVRTIDEAFRDFGFAPRAAGIAPAAVVRAFAALPGAQRLNRVNRSVHAAAWCTRDGEIVLAREDVGRHNALDKLIGALAARWATIADPEAAAAARAEGFVVMTSRCSFELVQKCAVVGIGCLATVSAPTSLALEVAREAGLQVVVRATDGVVVFDPSAPGPR